MKELSLYIHIPFCESKCYYCDFCSFGNRFDLVDKYISYLKKEIDIYRDIYADYIIKTIFIGGGTPSIIEEEYIFDITNHLHKRFSMKGLEEFTIESNPNSLNDNKLKVYKESGINRISLGLQSMDNNILKDIGRLHTKEDFIKIYKKIRNHQFNNVNIDLMFNLPNQSVNDLLNTLKEVNTLSPEHISFYSLKVEEGTPFHDRKLKGKLDLPSEDNERKMYHKGIEFLLNKGYNHYEISNFSKRGYESKHNLAYWQVKPYIGLGLAAHSNINNKRYGNFSDFQSYFSSIDNKKLPIDETEYIDENMEMSEYAILGLRLTDGINKDVFYKRFNINFDEIFGENIKKLISRGLLIEKDSNISLTPLGLDLSNIVFMELLP